MRREWIWPSIWWGRRRWPSPGPLPDGSPGDVVTVAKVLKDFARVNPALVVKGGLLEGAPLDADAVRRLADIEPREVLLAKLAGLMAAPMQQFAGLLQALPRNFAYGLQALIDKGGASGAPVAATDTVADTAVDGAEDTVADEAPVEDTVAQEAPVDETPRPTRPRLMTPRQRLTARRRASRPGGRNPH